ncbi:MAG: lysylphosphatidylglycerol synthase domain-containing protein [Acidiferrobacter sp.]
MLTATPLRRPRLLAVLALVAGFSGLAGAVVLLVDIGIRPVLALLIAVGWGFLWLVPVRLAVVSINAWAWRVLLVTWERLPLWFLMWVALVRDAINNLLPVLRVGGDAAGLRLLVRHGLSAPVALASMVVETTTTIFVQIIFSLIGVGLLLSYAPDNHLVRGIALMIVGALVVGVAFVIVQRKAGLFAGIERVVTRVVGRTFNGGQGGASVDYGLNNLYQHPGRVLRCGLWQFMSLLGGAGEVWVILRLLGYPAGPRLAILFESIIQGLQSAAFIVPGALGVQEGGLVAVGLAAGVPPDVALALSIGRRLRQIAFGVPVLALWMRAERREHRGGAAVPRGV